MANKLLTLILLAAAVSEPQSCEIPQNLQNQEGSAVEQANSQNQASKTAIEESPSASCPYLIETTPRGLSCLHCLEPKAEEQANSIVKILAASCLKNVAINYLVDGSFEYNPELLKKHIDILTADNRRLFLHLYLINGPSQRRYKNTSSEGFAADMEPEKFREKILEDKLYQAKYKSFVKGFSDVLEYAKSKNAVLSIVPVLEDNLETDSFEKIAELTVDALPEDLNVLIGRNPCPGCYDGNDHKVPRGYFKESHDIRNAAKIRDGLITNDGDVTEVDFRNNEVKDDLSVEALIKARDLCSENNNAFILWNASYQGLDATSSGSFKRKDYSEREYVEPNIAERSWLINFLRGDLKN